MGKGKQKASKKRKAPKGHKTSAPAKDHKREFEQLLDDAIFGVRKKD